MTGRETAGGARHRAGEAAPLRPSPPAPDRDAAAPLRAPSPRASQWPLVLAAVVIVLAGFGIALVEAYRFPKGSVWIVVGVAVVLVALIRVLGRRH